MSTVNLPAIPIGTASTSSSLAALLGQQVELGNNTYRLVKASADIANAAGAVCNTTIVTSAPSWLVAASSTAIDPLAVGIIPQGQVGSGSTSTTVYSGEYFYIQTAGITKVKTAGTIAASTGLTAGSVALGQAAAVSATYAAVTADNTTNVPDSLLGAGTADMVATISQDYGVGTFDYESARKTRNRVGLVRGFDSTVIVDEAVSVSDGSGQYYQMLNYYQGQQDFKKFSSRLPFNGMSIRYANNLKTDATYDVYTIDHSTVSQSNLGMPAFNPHRTTIGIISFQDADTTYYTGSANGQKTYFETTLNGWGALVGVPAVNI